MPDAAITITRRTSSKCWTPESLIEKSPPPSADMFVPSVCGIHCRLQLWRLSDSRQSITQHQLMRVQKLTNSLQAWRSTLASIHRAVYNFLFLKDTSVQVFSRYFPSKKEFLLWTFCEELPLRWQHREPFNPIRFLTTTLSKAASDNPYRWQRWWLMDTILTTKSFGLISFKWFSTQGLCNVYTAFEKEYWIAG